MKNKRKKDKKLLYIGIFVIIFIILIILGIYLSKDNDELKSELKKDGYTTEESDAFYKKIVTNNTLDDFYDDLSNNKETSYEEYYFSKDSYDFIELKMSYKDGITTTLNITSALRTLEVNFNYELSYNSTHLIIEGDSTDEYTCKTVVQEGISDATVSTYCDAINSEITTFLNRRTELLSNQKIQELVNKPIESVTEE
jgi:hypothetical protein